MSLTTYRLDRDRADRLLVLLHGWSAEQHHLAAYVPLVDPDERFTASCPRAPHDLPDGDGASWYDRTAAGPDPDSYAEAIGLLRTFIAAEQERTGVGPERTVIGGFSQGGFLALTLALDPAGPRFAGVWAMCCGLADATGVEHDLWAGSGRPALLQYGERDAIIVPERTVAAGSALNNAGWDVTLHGYDMDHTQRIEMMVDARSWLTRID